MMVRQACLLLFWALLTINAVLTAAQAAPAPPRDVQATWVGLRTLQLTWSQASDANRVTVTRCGPSGGSCYLVAVVETRPGRNQVIDRHATGGDAYWIGEFISQADGGLIIHGWTGPTRVPDRLTYLPSISGGPDALVATRSTVPRAARRVSEAHSYLGMTHTLYHGDSLTILPTLPDVSVDAIITDPPYSSGGTSSRERTSRSPRDKYQTSGTERTYPTFYGEARDQRSFGYWSTLWLSECLRLAKPGAPICVFTDWRQLPILTDALQAGGWTWRGIVPWHKPTARPQVGRFTNQCEYVVWGSNGAMAERRAIGVLAGMVSASVLAKDKLHLTAKPLDVMRHLVRICDANGTILDPFAGSGSTGVAALESGRRFIGIEQSVEYTQIAGDRLAAVTLKS